MLTRRSLLVMLAASPALIATRKGGHAAQRLVETDQPETRLVLPNLASDRSYPTITFSSAAAYQGGAIRISVDRAARGAAYVFGRTYILDPDGAGGAAGYIAFGTEDPPGPVLVSLDILEPGADWFSLSREVTVLPTDWTVDYITLPPPEEPDPNAPPPPPPPPDETYLLPDIYAGVTPRKWTAGWHAPLDEPLSVTGYFGEQRSFNGGPVQGHHGGTDLGANAGDPIYATNDGVVVLSGLYLVRGNLIVVDHGSGVFSAYGHQSERVAQVGDYVSKGDVIGYVGTTGLSTGPHLHWEMAVSGVLVDGLRWLDGSQGF
ncbi:MAG: M23 family metallopeptidase [Hyphomicrobiales bacterium]